MFEDIGDGEIPWILCDFDIVDVPRRLNHPGTSILGRSIYLVLEY